MALNPYSLILRFTLKRFKNVDFYLPKRTLISRQLVYNEFGDPLNVVKYRECEVPKLKPQEVLVRMLAAPVNPADINTIQGRDPILPCLPTIPGGEGVGKVVEIGDKVSRIRLSDRVLINKRLLGTWRYYGIYDERDLYVISKALPLSEAAMLSIAPCTAYRLLKDFVKLKPNMSIIQNGANSTVGQFVIQLCKMWNIYSINIVSTYCNYKSVKEHLKGLGATVVCTPDDSEKFLNFDTSIVRPILGLNCLYGKQEDLILKAVAKNGMIVNYADAYDLPYTKAPWRPDATFCRFNLNEWDKTASHIERDIMITDIVQDMVIGNLKAPRHHVIDLKDFVYALQNTGCCGAYSNLTYIFDFTVP